MTTLKHNRQHVLAACVTLLIVAAAPIAGAQKTPSQSADQTSANQPTRALIGATSDSSSSVFAESDNRDTPILATKLRFSLSGYEYFPTRSDLDRIGSPDLVIDELIRIANSPDERPSLRVRAIDALGYYDETQSTEFLAKQINPASPPPNTRVARSIRHHSIVSFAKAARENAVETLQPLIDHSDLQIRLTAINAIGKHGGTIGQNVLKSLDGPAQHPAVLRELRKYGVAE